MGRNASKDPLVSLGKIFNLDNEGGVPSISSAEKLTHYFGQSIVRILDILKKTDHRSFEVNDSFSKVFATFTIYDPETSQKEKWDQYKVVTVSHLRKIGLKRSFGTDQVIVIQGERHKDGESYGILRQSILEID
ncbi:MAG TPA: hypothetical protein PKI93_07600 [Alphaproteobacteria bacterium]|nr:hypothetical protein [Alphaproteobacteria bacterium]HNS45395.1 hypothetical protein [Alphaproteobacteria bacterium]